MPCVRTRGAADRQQRSAGALSPANDNRAAICTPTATPSVAGTVSRQVIDVPMHSITMRAMRRRRTLPALAWIALLSIAINALVPTLSRAMAIASPVPVLGADICSVVGPERRPLDASSKPLQGTPPVLLHMGQDCPYCGAHAGSYAMPPPGTLPGLTLQPSSGGAIGSYPDVPDPLFVWAAERSRGPPAAN